MLVVTLTAENAKIRLSMRPPSSTESYYYLNNITIKRKQSKLVYSVGCWWTLMSAAMTKSIFKLFPILLANVLLPVMPKTRLSHPTDFN